MPIQFKCANGHVLVAEDRLAGSQGRCPKCGQEVHVPRPVATRPARVSDDDLADLLSHEDRAAHDPIDDEHVLGSHETGHGGHDPGSSSTATGYATSESSLAGGSRAGESDDRACPRCKTRIRPRFMVCPRCGTYISSGRSAPAIAASLSGHMTHTCPSCLAKSFPGDRVCSQCGTPFGDD